MRGFIAVIEPDSPHQTLWVALLLASRLHQSERLKAHVCFIDPGDWRIQSRLGEQVKLSKLSSTPLLFWISDASA